MAADCTGAETAVGGLAGGTVELVTTNNESVWDDGPQYPDIWGSPTGEPAVNPPAQPPESPHPPVEPAADPIQPNPDPIPSAPTKPAQQRRRWPMVVGVLLLLALAGGLVWLFTSGDDSGGELGDDLPVPTLPATIATTPPTTVLGGAVTAPPITLAPETTPATTPPTVAPTAAPTTAAPATVPPPPDTTTPPTVPATVPATAPPIDGPVVTIESRVGPCSFGSNCLIAGFTIEGFDQQPTEFVCEFADKSRYTFKFDSDGVEYACATGGADDTITIEVAGVRSETATRP